MFFNLCMIIIRQPQFQPQSPIFQMMGQVNK
jgi:hypothetical protein